MPASSGEGEGPANAGAVREGARKSSFGPGGFLFPAVLAASSGAASVAAVRLAAPSALDETATVLFLFFLLPALPLFLLSFFRRPAAPAVFAAALPFLWTFLAWEAPDSLLVWAVPASAGALIAAALRIALRRGRSFISLKAAAPGAFLFAAAALFWPVPGPSGNFPRLLLIGIDGATWDRIDPLVARGAMPNFDRLLTKGRRAVLTSLPSMYSPQVWTTIATGCLPSQHGIEDFSNTQYDLKVGRIWDRLHREGRSFGTCGWYFTWPPPSGMGERDFDIPCFLAPRGAAYPPEYSFLGLDWACKGPGKKGGKTAFLKAGIEAFRNGVRLSTLRRMAWNFAALLAGGQRPRRENWKSWLLYSSFTGDAFAELVRARRPEFAAVFFKELDRISHFRWKVPGPGVRPGSWDEEKAFSGGAVEAAYIEMDRILGRILAAAPGGMNVVIVSDHGFQGARPRMAGKYCRIRTTELIDLLGLTGRLTGRNMDPKVYLGALGPDAPLNKAVLDKAQALLAAARLAKEERPFFEVERKDPWLWVEPAARSSLPPGAELKIAGRNVPLAEIADVTEEPFWPGVHHPDGIFLLSGPSAARAITAQRLSVLDVAPTLAAILHLPRSPLWTGRSAVEGEPRGDWGTASYTPPPFTSSLSYEPDKDLEERLREIGYLK